MSWLLVCALIAGTFAIRASGLALIDGVPLSPTLELALAWAPFAIISGLVVLGTVGADPSGLTLDARAVGIGAGLVAVLLRAPFLVVFLVVVAATVGVRSIT